MSPATDGGYAFIVLLRDADDASGLARLLEDVRLPDASVPSVFAAPPVRGLDFFADDKSQETLDQWWGDNIPGNALPVYLLNHEDGLFEWIQGLDGTFYIGLPTPQLADGYGDSSQIRTFMSGGPLDYATVIMRDFSGGNGSGVLLFDEGEALRMAALSSDFPIDLDDSAFDFGDAVPEPAAAGAGFGAPSGFGAAPPVFGGAPPAAAPSAAPAAFGGSPATNPFDLMGANAGFGGAGFAAPPPAAAPAPPPRKRTPAEPTTAHPFDLMSGGGAGQTAPYPSQSAPAFPPQAPPGSGAPVPLTPPPPLPSGPAPGYGGASGGDAWSGGTASQPAWMGDQTGFASKPSPSRTEAGFSQTTGGVGKKGSKFSLDSVLPFGKKGRPGFTETPQREFAQMMVDRGPTIVVMGSRKGGVGKTSYAAGIAIVAGTVLDTIGHKAAIVDANIANPDAWGQMNLREGAATVRQVVAALTSNSEPPPPVHAMTPALACYPESRETTEYSKTDIKRLAEYLRRRFTFIVVDMSNRLPDPMAGPEAAAAAFWLEHADVLVLPTTSSKQDFNGVLDYLDVRGLPPTVVPYIIPNIKRNRDHPVTLQYLSVIRERVHRIVEVPDEADKVRYAGMEGVPVEQVSPALKAAYRELTEVIVRVPPRARI